MTSATALSVTTLFTGNALARVISICISLVTAPWLARELRHDYGSYGALLYLIYLLAIPASCGLNQSLTHLIAEGRKTKAHSELFATVCVALFASLGIAIAISMFALLGHHIFCWHIDSRAFLIASLCVPLLVLLQICRSILQGMDLPLRGSFIEAVGMPCGMLATLATARYLLGLKIDLFVACAAFFIALFIACVPISIETCRHIAMPFMRTKPNLHLLTRIFSHGAPFLLGQSVFAISSRAPLLLLAWSSSQEESGSYFAAATLASYVSFPLTTLNPMIAGRVARLYAGADTCGLQILLRSSAKLCFFAAAPFGCVLVFFGPAILGIFDQFVPAGYYALVILTLAELGNSAAGSVGVVATMTGNAAASTKVAATSAVVGVLACFLLIPFFGAVGAAVGQATTLLVFNASLVRFSVTKLRLNPTIWCCCTGSLR